MTKMRAVLGLFALGLCAQATLGNQVRVSFAGVRPVNQEADNGIGFSNVLRAAPLTNNVPQADVVPSGGRELQPFRDSELQEHRQLAIVEVWVDFWFLRLNTDYSYRMTVTKLNGEVATQDVKFTTVESIHFWVLWLIDDSFLNEDMDDVCDTCRFETEQLECDPVIGCDIAVVVEIKGDPHMVGLLGQKIDWAGVDNAWYCLLSDGPNLHVNVRLSAPMPEEFPDRQLISAVSVLTDDGLHSLVVEVKDPYITTTNGCPKDSSVTCLADGGLRILVDGEESAAMQAPAVNVHLPGNPPVVVSSANLPAECRPFGGDRIWATQFSEMIDHRSLRSASVSFADWILQPDTLAAPTWCAKFLEEGGSAGLLSTPTQHATLRVETPAVTVRINVGVNYQDLETAPDGTVLVPELEFWQTDLGFDGLRLSNSVGGLMGDTSRFVLDNEGEPVTSGLGALHAPVDSYRVAGPFARDFEKLHG